MLAGRVYFGKNRPEKLCGRKSFLQDQGTRAFFSFIIQQQQVGWPNGKALDYESRDCRFDPCVDQHTTSSWKEFTFCSSSAPQMAFCHDTGVDLVIQSRRSQLRLPDVLGNGMPCTQIN
jgi:hypothetical protein